MNDTSWVSKLPKEEIILLSKKNDIDPVLVFSIIKIESNCDPYAVRYEPMFTYKKEIDYYARTNKITHATENILQACSIGLMQTMGVVAREMGFQKNLLLLTNPLMSIDVGIKKLKSISRFFKHNNDMAAAYNAGTVVKDDLGRYRNFVYVDKVMSIYKEIKCLV